MFYRVKYPDKSLHFTPNFRTSNAIFSSDDNSSYQNYAWNASVILKPMMHIGTHQTVHTVTHTHANTLIHTQCTQPQYSHIVQIYVTHITLTSWVNNLQHKINSIPFQTVVHKCRQQMVSCLYYIVNDYLVILNDVVS